MPLAPLDPAREECILRMVIDPALRKSLIGSVVRFVRNLRLAAGLPKMPERAIRVLIIEPLILEIEAGRANGAARLIAIKHLSEWMGMSGPRGLVGALATDESRRLTAPPSIRVVVNNALSSPAPMEDCPRLDIRNG